MIKVLIFDLDGTLYEEKRLLKLYKLVSISILSEFMGIDQKEAKRRLKEEKERLEKNLGYKPSFAYTLKALGVPTSFRNSKFDELIKPELFLKRDGKLRKFLVGLKDKFKLAVVTNNTRHITEKILRILGIGKCFDYILTITETERIKPDPELYRKVMKKFRAKSEECLVIGDRYPLDLKPAEELGMSTLKIERKEELYDAIIQVQG